MGVLPRVCDRYLRTYTRGVSQDSTTIIRREKRSPIKPSSAGRSMKRAHVGWLAGWLGPGRHQASRYKFLARRRAECRGLTGPDRTPSPRWPPGSGSLWQEREPECQGKGAASQVPPCQYMPNFEAAWSSRSSRESALRVPRSDRIRP